MPLKAGKNVIYLACETLGVRDTRSVAGLQIITGKDKIRADYVEEAISVRAAKITDQLLEMLAMHTFKGGIIAPQGRVYRGVLYPFSAGAMALMNLADPGQPFDFGESWLGFYATSKYQFPKNLKKLMESEASTNYVTGNARIVLEKHQDWCLTSVQSPREPFTRWENGVRKPDTDPSSHAFVKSYNECFHGTTHFQPGVYGYQQHLWYAALDGEAAVFINHPGSTSESGDMRPGYWHGNGVFPALRQESPLLGMIYRIPENYPLHYIHLYCPECRFDEVEKAGDWLLLRRGNGYIGVHFSGMLFLACPLSLRPTFAYFRNNLLAVSNYHGGNPYILSVKNANSVFAKHAWEYLFCLHPYLELLRLIRGARKAPQKPINHVTAFFFEKDEIVGKKASRLAKQQFGFTTVQL
ncbi:MAG: hypothetical protein IKP72_05635, partial [Clostridia bacterium]|nr:hypothetical protein [Clostridia bacterium]